MTPQQRFPMDTQVRLVCAPEIRGHVIGYDGENVRVHFTVENATGTHSPDALLADVPAENNIAATT